MELWQSLLVAFGGNAALLLVLGFLGRSVMSSVLARDIEQFKATLKVAAVEHQIRFSKLHEKRAEVLAELYKLLVAAVWQVSTFTAPMQFGEVDRKKQFVDAIDAVTTYFRFFDQRRIWLPQELCEPLESFARELRTPAIHLGTYVRIEHPTEKTLEQQSEVWDKLGAELPADLGLQLTPAAANRSRRG